MLEELTNLYPISKTLRFELQPVGNTLANIQKNGLLESDEQRANDYQKVKLLIDKYHKAYIEERLANFKLETGLLEAYMDLYVMKQRTDKEETVFDKIKEKLRKAIADRLTKGSDKYKTLFKKEFIKNDLPAYIDEIGGENVQENKELVSRFGDFTTYFVGFFENRKNMYSADDKSTAIAYRLIHQNLPKFIDNIRSFAKIEEAIGGSLQDVYNGFEEYLNVRSVSELFQLDYFTDTLTQAQIEVYNYVIGGRVTDEGEVVVGVNQYINLYNQQNKGVKLPLLQPLYKQILSDREQISYRLENFSNDREMITAINDIYSRLKPIIFTKYELEGQKSLQSLLISFWEYNLSGVYIKNDLSLTTISQQLYGDYARISDAIIKILKSQFPRKVIKRKEEANEEYEERIKSVFNKTTSFSVEDIDNALAGSEVHKVEEYFMSLGVSNRSGKQECDLFARIEVAYTDAEEALRCVDEKHKLAQDKTAVAKIKDLLDAIKQLQHFVKPLLGSGEEAEKDSRFYGDFTPLWETLDEITPLYNKVRSWLTQKPYSTEKYKLNFENKGDFLGGWVDSKTDKSDNGTQAGGYLFRKLNSIGEYDYYLGMSKDAKLFRRSSNVTNPSEYERLDYYQLKKQTLFGSSYKGNYQEDNKCIVDSMKTIAQITGEFEVEANKTAITILREIRKNNPLLFERIMKDSSCSEACESMRKHLFATLSACYRVPAALELSSRKDLPLIDLFDAAQNLPTKSFSYFPVGKEELNEAINRECKALYLFKITNKDLSYAEKYSDNKRESRGKENLHTIYFRELMEGCGRVFDIGVAKVFFRKHSISYKNEVWEKGHHYEALKGKFKYPIISNKRYAIDKFTLHLSMTLNYDSPNAKNINERVNSLIREHRIKHVIGIDRGERHLLYLSMIDMRGNIVKQMTLNDILVEYKGETHKTDYQKLLAQREKERKEQRQSWESINKIKDLKEGYLSQAIHVVTKMMIENDAIMVLEDLNHGFVRGRQKIERQVYEKFEKMLIDKLSLVVDKRAEASEPSGVLRALQLVNGPQAKGGGKQNGCLFYIPAWNTSKIDPVTGFVNLFDTRAKNREQAKSFFSKFDSIVYNEEKDWFEFKVDYHKFDKAEGSRSQWLLCTYGDRIRTFRNPDKNSEWDNQEINLTSSFKALFADYGIDIHGNLKQAIVSRDEARFFDEIMRLFKLLVQMRNSVTNSETDYMISPVADAHGIFFDSRKAGKALPENADANGAYNIARKGLWALRRIECSKEGEKVSLGIKNQEWLRYVQEKLYLNE